MLTLPHLWTFGLVNDNFVGLAIAKKKSLGWLTQDQEEDHVHNAETDIDCTL